MKVDEISTGYKETILGILPVDWSVVQLKDKFDRITTKNKKGVTNVLTISAQHGLINQEMYFKKSVASKDLSNYILLEKGDFAYNKSYSNGYPYGAIKKLSKYDEGVVSSLYICFKPSLNNKTPEFYEHYFEAGMFNHEIHAIAQEGARNHGLLNVSIGDFFNSYIIDADEEELNKIASILSTWDKAIELKEKLIEQKKEQKKGLMQKLLTGEVRLPGFEGEWREVNLAKVSKRIKGKAVEYLEDGKFPVIDMDYLESGLFKNFSNDATVFAKKQDVLLLWDGSRAGMAFTGVEGAVGSTFVKLECKSIHNIFLQKHLEMNESKIQRLREGSGIPHVPKDFLNFYEIKMPSLDEQQAISNVLNNMDKDLELLQKEIVYLKHQKQGLMQQLLTGKIRVKV